MAGGRREPGAGAGSRTDAGPGVDSGLGTHAGPGAGPAIRMRGLKKHFGRVHAVAGVDLDIPAGSVYGLIGPNGAGKTTTFALVCGWLRPTAGAVEVLGHPAGDVAHLSGRVLALPQDAVLPPRIPIRESLAFLGTLQGMRRTEAGAEAERVLEIVGLGERSDARAATLSHGMAKRAALAQALMGSPELILLDEPTAGLDPRSAHNVRSLMASLRGRATVVVSSHNLQELEELCDHAAILEEGRVVASGTMEELTSSNREMLVEFANDPAEVRALAERIRELEEVGSAEIVSEGRLLVRFHLEVGGVPEVVVSQVLRALLEAGALVGRVDRGKGLERKVLSLGASERPSADAGR
jgi:ABC-2 type transport system ATP-binding protein